MGTGSEKKQDREGAEPREGRREKGKRSRRPGSGFGWRVGEAKPASHWQLTCSLCRPCTSLRTRCRACHPLGAGSAEQRGGEAGDESTEMAGGWGAGWAGEGTGHLGLMLRWERRSWAPARSKPEALVASGSPGWAPHSLCSFPPAPLHASRWACGHLRVTHRMGW